MNSSNTRSLQTVVLSLIVIGLIALALGGYLTPLSRLVLTPLVSAQTWLATRFQAIQSYVSAPQDMARLRSLNTQLEAENSRLQAEIIDLKQQLSETEVLRSLVQFARIHPENSYLAASVIGRDSSPFIQYVLINRGSDDGLRRGMPVVTQQGLVGRIAQVSPGAAKVQLITDPTSAINIRMEPSRAQAVLQGQLTGDLTVEMVPQSANITIGDVVLTSGLGGNYPENILIGQVAGVRKRDNDLFQSASIQPVVDFSQLEIVLVITNFRPIDIAPLQPTPSGP
jgi:rod shape-determining protein MreC